jgi:hypothetical protein
MARNLRMPIRKIERGQFGFQDDFLNFASGQFWTSLTTGGTVAIANVEPAGTVLQLVSGAVAENECDIYGTTAPFLPTPGKAIVLEADCQFAQASVNNIEVAFGLTSLATGAGLMQAAGAGPIASGSQVLMYTVKGDVNWHCQARNGTAFTDQASSTPATPDTNFHILTIEITDEGGLGVGQVNVVYMVDGVKLKPALPPGLTYPDIGHLLPTAALARMRPVFYLRAGAANAETVNLDYFGGWQIRAGNPLLF